MTDKQNPQIEQALAEKELAEAYDQPENVRAAEKRLESLGYKAAKRRAAAAADQEDAKASPPQGRTSRKPQNTAE